MADVSTEVAIATQTLGSAASSITFSSIPSTYTDLRLVMVCTTSAVGVVRIQFNGDTATNYSETSLAGNGATARSGSSVNKTYIDIDNLAGNTSATIPELYTIDVFSYAGSTYKTVLNTSSEDNNGSGTLTRQVGLWRSTSAITSIALIGSTFSIGTTATLYGIL